MGQDFKENPRLSELEELLGKKYKIISKIGSGGFGDVYLGEHLALRRKVAIKILHGTYSAQQDLVKRFQREARSAASLSHPNIIDIYDVGEGEGLYYFVMKYIEGETLAQRMQRGTQMPAAEAVHLVRQIADALAYAHENDVVHRDIKPANVMLDAFNRALLMDFGVARVQFEGNLTKTGTILGTPHYLPPEQPLGKPVDGRSDIYSLGIMFYEMLSGRLPFQDENSISLIFKHINEIPPSLSSLVPELHPELSRIVHKMIEKLPDNRFQHAGEISEALQTLSGVYPAPTPVPIRKSTPSVGRDTEQLILLAQEHLEQNKMSKALEIYSVVSKREPKNDTVRGKIDEILSRLLMRVEDHISLGEFGSAREILRQLEPLASNDIRVSALRKKIAAGETASSDDKETELKQFDAPLESSRRSSSAMASAPEEDASSAPTIIPSNPKLQEILRNTGARITSEDRKEVFDRLREIDAALTTGTEGDTEPTPEVQTMKVPEQPAAKKIQPPIAGKKSLFDAKRIAVFLLFGALLLGALMGISWLLNMQSQGTDSSSQISFLRKLAQSKETPEKPTTGKISVTSTPVGAKVFLGEDEKGVTPFQLPDMPFGKYVVKLKLDGYKDMQQEIELNEAAPAADVTATLEAATVVVGSLQVDSTPPGAHIIIKSRALGVTPKKLENLNPGKYTITLKMDGYFDYSSTVKVDEGQAATLTAQLQEIPKQEQPVEQKPAEPELKAGTLVELTDPGVTPPRSVKKTSLDYSKAPRDLKKYQGTVKMSLLISETGNVIDVKVTQSAQPILDQAAISLVKEWTYEPAKKQGVPVRVWLPSTITFVKR
jgi:TonB family protein